MGAAMQIQATNMPKNMQQTKLCYCTTAQQNIFTLPNTHILLTSCTMILLRETDHMCAPNAMTLIEFNQSILRLTTTVINIYLKPLI